MLEYYLAPCEQSITYAGLNLDYIVCGAIKIYKQLQLIKLHTAVDKVDKWWQLSSLLVGKNNSVLSS